MYRIWIEEVLGFRLRGNKLTIDPVLPDDWPGFEMTYRYRSTLFEISVRRREGEKFVTSPIQLVDDGGKHGYDRLAAVNIREILAVRSKMTVCRRC